MRVYQQPHANTTRHVAALYPWMSASRLGLGILIGTDVWSGAAFQYDPFRMYGEIITSPNQIVLGILGSGKSSYAKTYCARSFVFGYHSWVCDPKPASDGSDESEYCRMARALNAGRDFDGVLTLYPNGPTKINPLDVGGAPDEAFGRRLEISGAILEASLNRPLNSIEGSALTEAVRKISNHPGLMPTLRHLTEALLRPGPQAADACAMSQEMLAEHSRSIAHAMRRLVEGDLRGMLDGETTISAAALAQTPMVVFDLHRIYHSQALEVILACVASWFRRVLQEAPQGTRFTFIQDEGWAVLRRVAIARFMNERWKLARADGVSYMMIIHRRSDMLAAGAEGDEQVRLALGLLSDAETKIVYRQAPDEMDELAAVLRLTDTQKALVPQLENHIALWLVGQRAFEVHHVLSAWERPLVETSERMGVA